MNKDNIIAEIREKYEKSKTAKSKIVKDMNIWLSWYLGQQFSYYDKKTKTFRLPTDNELLTILRKQNVVLTQINKIKPAVKVVVSELTARQPALSVLPKSNKETAKAVAQIGSEILMYYRFRKEYLLKDIENAFWTVNCGKSYKYAHPNKFKAKKKTEEYMNPITGEVEKRTIYEKVPIDISVINPFEFFPPPGVRKIEDMPWIIIARYLDREVIEKKYDIKLSPGGEIPYLQFQANAFDLMENRKADQKLLIEYFEKPSSSNPNGKHIIIVDNEIILNDEYPYWKELPDGKREPEDYPIVEYTFDDSLVSHWGQGLPQPIIDVQKYINLVYSMLLTNIILTNAPKLLVPKSLKSMVKGLMNIPQVFLYDEGREKPGWLAPPPSSMDLPGILDKLERTFEELVGVHALSLGKEPLKRMPYLAIQYLRETDIAKFRPVFDRYEESERKLGFILLKAIKQYSPEFVFEILSPDKEIQIREFLDDNLDDYEVVVERGSSIPESKAGQIGMLLEMLKYNAFDMSNRTVRMEFLKAINTGWAKGMVEKETQSLNFANEENRRMLAGEPVPVHPAQDHEIHIEAHRKLYESSEYWQASIEIKEMIDNHFQEHQNYLAPPPQEQIPPEQGMPGGGQGAIPPQLEELLAGGGLGQPLIE